LWVLTDHMPDTTFNDEEVFWQAWGARADNLAIVGAMHGPRDGEPYCIVQVANFSDRDRDAAIRIADESGRDVAPARKVMLTGGASGTVMIELPDGLESVVVRVDDDTLAIDDRALLLAPPDRRLRVRLMMNESRLEEDVVEVLEATRRVRITEGPADLVITDHGEPSRTPNVWMLRFVGSSDPKAFAGPFLIDRAHPLCDGLDLDGVIWAAGDTPLPGRAIINAGNTVLLTDTTLSNRRRIIRVAMSRSHSTLTGSISWPVLMWNLLDYRLAAMPGPIETNTHLGRAIAVNVPLASETVTVTTPTGEVQDRTPREGLVVVPTEQTGRYTIVADDEMYAFAVNALGAQESDLRSRNTGAWGQWATTVDRQRHYSSVGWVALLVALAGMMAHQVLLGRDRRKVVS
jgi:hypothetical protein